MLAKRAFGKELGKNMQLWGHRHNTDIKLVENAAFVSESAPDKKQELYEELIPTAQEA